MNLNFRPGYVYIFFSKNRPADVKIGKAIMVDKRAFDLSLADPDIEVFACLFFLDVFSAETHMHRYFKTAKVGRERFEVTKKRALAELERLHQGEAAFREYFEQGCRYMADMGELRLDTSHMVETCDGSAVSTLLTHVPSAKDGRNVKTLLPVALGAGASALHATKLLANIGLLAYAVEGIILLDKSDNSRLAKFFNDKRCSKTWATQLAKFAGFRDNGRTVPLAVWLDKTEAGPDLVDRVSPYSQGSFHANV